MPWNEKYPLFLTLDLVEDMILGVRLGYRPGRGYDLGGQIRVSTSPEEQFWESNWGIDLPGRAIWGVKLGYRPPRKGNLGGQIGPATCPEG